MKRTITRETTVAEARMILSIAESETKEAVDAWASRPDWDTRRRMLRTIKAASRLTLEAREAMGL